MEQFENQLFSQLRIPICIISIGKSDENKLDYNNNAFTTAIVNSNQLSNIINSIEMNKQKKFMNNLQTILKSSTYTSELEPTMDCLVNDIYYDIHFTKIMSGRMCLQFIRKIMQSDMDMESQSLKNCSKFGNPFLDDHEALVDFVENSPRPMHVLDEEFNIIWSNKFELEVLGYKAEEFIGHNLVKEFVINGGVEQNKTMSTWNNSDNSYIDRFVHYQGKESIHIMRVIANRRMLGEGKWTSRSVLSDDTQLLQLEEAKEQQRKLTENMLELKRTFVRYVSHEIRSPLNVLYGGLQLLMEESTTKNNPELSESVTDLFTSATQAIEILNDMLQYEKIEAGKFDMEKDMIPLCSWDIFAQCYEISPNQQDNIFSKLATKDQ
eukprot:gene7500-10218_t